MLIALPNTDGSFTATLFLPREGADSFAACDRAAGARASSRATSPTRVPLIPDLEQRVLRTSAPASWARALHALARRGRRLLLIGDAAHAIVPFHGQGMNCAFEDCVVLDELLGTARRLGHASSTSSSACGAPNAEAIATMALENYVEMRDTVRDPHFQLQKALSLELERAFRTASSRATRW